MNTVVNLIIVAVIAFTAYTISQDDKRLGANPKDAERAIEASSATPAKTWSRSPVSGQWIEHNRTVGFMSAIGGGGGGCSLHPRQSADTLRRDEGHRQATPKLQGTTLDRTRPRF